MPAEDTLRRWVEEHKVCYEVAPLTELVDHKLMKIGYELRLFARHEQGVVADPGCAHCQDLFGKLRAIALFALPQENRPSKYEIAPFDASLHLRPESQRVPEVQLTIRVVHRERYLRPEDECERRCAKEIQDWLRSLGVQSKSWSERRATPALGAIPGKEMSS